MTNGPQRKTTEEREGGGPRKRDRETEKEREGEEVANLRCERFSPPKLIHGNKQPEEP